MIFKVLKFPSCLPAVSRTDAEGNAHGDLIVRLPFASLFDTLGM